MSLASLIFLFNHKITISSNNLSFIKATRHFYRNLFLKYLTFLIHKFQLLFLCKKDTMIITSFIFG
ncbi:hypothetical protein B6D60_09845 [candidate division KSB1 bacterium 4484_87]|nr:MAG: hypothetical protein B6D60_09845 [candidate division KSB1 bacterium 4484_87]